jgi:hypothetical protein
VWRSAAIVSASLGGKAGAKGLSEKSSNACALPIAAS